MMLAEKIKLRKTNYYQLIHRKTQMALYIGSTSSDFKGEKASLVMSNPQSLGQCWLVIEVDEKKKPNLYEIVHTRSTLVLECLRPNILKRMISGTQTNEMRLRFGNWQQDQLFFLEQPDPSNFPNIYRFKAEKHPTNYMFYENLLKCDEINPNDEACHWQLRLCHENPIINRSCYLENAFSTLVVDVPAASMDSGKILIQYYFNNRFNQRFNIYKKDEYYVIENLNSKMFMAIKNNSDTIGTPIIQTKNNNKEGSWWKIEYQGKNLYLIRSAIKSKLLLGIQDNSFDIETPLVTTTNEEMSLWKIIGFIPH